MTKHRVLGHLWIPVLVSASLISPTAGEAPPINLPVFKVSANVPLVKTAEFHMLEKRFAAAVAAKGKYIYVIGGQGADGKLLGSIERFDTETGESKLFGSLHTPRLWHRAVVVENKIFVLGGASTTTRPLPKQTEQFVDTLRLSGVAGAQARIDAASDWEPQPSGQKPLDPLKFEGSVEILDLETATVSPGVKLPDARSDFGCVYVLGKIYVLGGKHLYRNRDFAYTNTVHVFDVKAGKWADGVPVPIASGGDAIIVDGPFVVVAGGYNGKRPLDEVVSFSPLRNTWAQVSALCRASSAHTTVFLGKYMFLFGNYESPDETLAYNLVSKKSETFTLQYQPSRHAAATSCGGKIFVFGGKPTRYSSPLDAIQVFELTSAIAPRPK